jgi:hypothetical protein
MHVNIFVNVYFRIQFPHMQRFSLTLFLRRFFRNGYAKVLTRSHLKIQVVLRIKYKLKT